MNVRTFNEIMQINCKWGQSDSKDMKNTHKVGLHILSMIDL